MTMCTMEPRTEQNQAQLFSQYEDGYSRLFAALTHRSYSSIYGLLRQLPKTFPKPLRFPLARSALGCTTRALGEVLDRCGPLDRLLSGTERRDDPLGNGYSLVTAAAYAGEKAALELLLERGADVNAGTPDATLPLEASVLGRQLECTALLCKIPELHQPMTLGMKDLWALGGMDDLLLDWCLQHCYAAMYPDLPQPMLGVTPISPDVPLSLLLEAKNWQGVIFHCQEGYLTPADVDRVFRAMRVDRLSMEAEPQLVEQLVDSLLSFYPPALSQLYPKAVLAALSLTPQFAHCPKIKSWMQRVNHGCIQLLPVDVDWVGEDGLLERWQEVLGEYWIPAISRNRKLPLDRPGGPVLFPEMHPQFNHVDQEELLQFHRLCKVVGKPPEGKLSDYALAALSLLPLDELAQALGKGGNLYKEDPDLLLAAAGDPHCDPERRAVLLACIRRKEEGGEPYDL